MLVPDVPGDVFRPIHSPVFLDVLRKNSGKIKVKYNVVKVSVDDGK